MSKLDNQADKISKVEILNCLQSRFFLSGLTIAILFWFIDPLIDVFIVEDVQFLETLLHPDKHEIYMRSCTSLAVIIYSLIASFILNRARKTSLELSHSEDRYRSVIHATTDVIWTTDGTGQFISPQPAWENFTRQTWEEYKGFGWANALHPEDADRMKGQWLIACEEKKPFYCCGKIWNAASKSWRICEVKALPISNEDGSLREWVGVITDITERNRTKNALQESERKFRTLFESSNVGIAACDMDGNLLDMNQAFLDLIGYTEEEARNLSYWDITPKDYEEQEQLQLMYLKETGKYGPYEKEYIHKNGERKPVLLNGMLVNIEDRKYIWSIIQDISERKNAEQQLLRFTHIFKQSLNEIYLFKEDSYLFVDVNKTARENLGYSMEELRKMTPLDIKPEMARTKFEEAIAPLKNKEQELVVFETTHQRKDGSLYDVEVHLQMIQHDEERLFNAMILDITERKKANEKLIYLASHDSLTNLINRYEFERIASRIVDSAINNKETHAFCFFDLDQFKVINDTCGHVAGDELLRQVTSLLKNVVRQRDIVARLGGDEFGILMEHCTLDNAYRVASSIESALEDYLFLWQGRSFRIAASMGLVPITETTSTVTDLMKDADTACFIAKDSGRNRIHIFNADDNETTVRKGELQQVVKIQKSLEEDRFCLYAQAIDPLNNKQGKRYELLIRMIGENDELIPPGAFLSAAERYNLITKVDRWVIGKAFELFTEYPEQLSQIEYVSINLSGQSLTNKEMLGYLSNLLAEHVDIGSKLCFEITETTAITNMDMARKLINDLKKFGCRFALDDFGSGLSSFGYLKNLPVDYLKIDGVFIKDIANDPIDHAMVKSINEIGKIMQMETIAEFVENDLIKGMLKEIGVDFVQGYGIGMPEPFENILSSPQNVVSINNAKSSKEA